MMSDKASKLVAFARQHFEVAIGNAEASSPWDFVRSKSVSSSWKGAIGNFVWLRGRSAKGCASKVCSVGELTVVGLPHLSRFRPPIAIENALRTLQANERATPRPGHRRACGTASLLSPHPVEHANVYRESGPLEPENLCKDRWCCPDGIRVNKREPRVGLSGGVSSVAWPEIVE